MMTEPWAEPCPESDPVFDNVYDWVSRKASKRRSRVILGGRPGLIRACSRETTLSFTDVSDAWDSLLDQEIMEKTDEGFLVTEKFVRTFRLSRRSRGEEAILVAERLDGVDTNFPVLAEAEPNRPPAVKQGSVHRRVDLCRHFFPDLVEEHELETIPRALYWKALCSQVKRLQSDYCLDIPFVRRMMEEFVRHPEWCRQSARAAWQVFISHWQQLVKLVQLQRHRDPGNRQFSHNGGTEYWLGKYA